MGSGLSRQLGGGKTLSLKWKEGKLEKGKKGRSVDNWSEPRGVIASGELFRK